MIEVKKIKGGYRFFVTAANGRILSRSALYKNIKACHEGAIANYMAILEADDIQLPSDP